MTGFGLRRLLGAAILGLSGLGAFVTPRAVAAPRDILIGAVYPLSGSAAAIGHDAEIALETEAAIINGHHHAPMLLGQGGGLPALGGAKVKLVFADSQNNPQIASSEAQRLITEDHVVAIIGSYTSATAVTISQICDRYQVP
ncbi:MAG TPA: ABC transporter substrate-binding protein [Acetobacteraceae bacterium]|nr:ABC transporter substrate-binding protein [Acetobacteraceae bacterium]